MASSFISETTADWDSDDSLSHYEFHDSDEETDSNELHETLEAPCPSEEEHETKAAEQGKLCGEF